MRRFPFAGPLRRVWGGRKAPAETDWARRLEEELEGLARRLEPGPGKPAGRFQGALRRGPRAPRPPASPPSFRMTQIVREVMGLAVSLRRDMELFQVPADDAMRQLAARALEAARHLRRAAEAAPRRPSAARGALELARRSLEEGRRLGRSALQGLSSRRKGAVAALKSREIHLQWGELFRALGRCCRPLADSFSLTGRGDL